MDDSATKLQRAYETERLLGSGLESALKKLCQQYLSFFVHSNRLERAHNHLDALEMLTENKSVLILFEPVVSHALTAYVSAFNSSRSFVSMDYRKMFKEPSARELHKFLVSYRNSELAHIEIGYTDFFLRTDQVFKQVNPAGSVGTMPLLVDFGFGTKGWSALKDQVLQAHEGYKSKADQLKSQIDSQLAEKPDEWFEGLPVFENGMR